MRVALRAVARSAYAWPCPAAGVSTAMLVPGPGAAAGRVACTPARLYPLGAVVPRRYMADVFKHFVDNVKRGFADPEMQRGLRELAKEREKLASSKAFQRAKDVAGTCRWPVLADRPTGRR